MTTYDLQTNMVPSPYGDTDQWISASPFRGSGQEWVEIRMRARYTRRVERFSVLYQGPSGAMRLEQDGPQVSGPLGCMIPQATVIASTPVDRARYIDAQAGDVLIMPGGQRMTIVDDKPRTDYPRLISEVEFGLEAAMALVRARLSDAYAIQRGDGDDIDRAKAAAQADTLACLLLDMRVQCEPLRVACAATT